MADNIANPETSTAASVTRHLIIIAHGSRREASNEHFLNLSKKLAQQTENAYKKVHPCFLEMVAPKLLETIDIAVSEGAQQIDIFPYFLGPGNHVLEDIPELMDTATSNYPRIDFKQLDYFGSVENMADLIHQAIDS